MSKFESGGIDLFNHSAGSGREVHRLAAPIMGCVFARDPSFVFETMQQGNQGWLLNPEMRCNFGLGQRAWGNRQMHQGPPFGLAQPHGRKPFVQFQAPGPGGPVEERSEKIDIVRFHERKIVSLLTNSRSVALSMPAPYSILSSKIDSFR